MHRKQKFNEKRIIARSNIAIQHKLKHIGDFSLAKSQNHLKFNFK